MTPRLAAEVRALVREELGAILGKAGGGRQPRARRVDVVDAERALRGALGRLAARGTEETTSAALVGGAGIEATRSALTVAGRVLAGAGWVRGARVGARGEGGRGGGRERVWRRG